ncbi:MAG TPA: glycosyltransferase family 2 protein [Sphingopyxis sp.]|nr:glycosyltransferase family 2 protein [Sphingopyxis sp.]
MNANIPHTAATVDVVIVNYRTGTLVAQCLESLDKDRQYCPGLRVIVVDNASNDGSADLIDEVIRARNWDWATLMRSPENRGFGAGSNLGIAWALDRPDPADLVWLLNPDTRVIPGAANALARFMAAHPGAGIAGSALLDADGQPWPYAFRFPSLLGEIERGSRLGFVSRLLRDSATLRRMGPRCEKVDWVSGASFIIRRELLEDDMRFDEEYFLYYEETDFCLHAMRKGWECWYVPDAVVLHIAGQSTGITGKQIRLRRLPAYWFHSRRRYFLKNHGRLYGILADFSWIVAHALARFKQLARDVAEPDPPYLFQDFIRHAAFLPRRR